MISRDEMQEKVDIVKGKIEKNKTVPYYFLASIFVLGALFFFSSNLLFNKELNLITTEINQEMYLNNISFSIKDRKYNPNNGYKNHNGAAVGYPNIFFINPKAVHLMLIPLLMY